ncbi:MAG: valine--tRNA ligase [Armatimonadota bacterium]|nr:valine--tRNA ligase [Armatimonadota bacterium]
MATENERDELQLPKVYDPKTVEDKWYKFWLEKLYFAAQIEPGKKQYCITIPPPNVTGSLHIGHALCYSIQDVLTRWKRMQGYETLCLPGTDHAGIATQNKVEQQLAEVGLTRHDIGREEFLKRVWAWKEHYGGTILNQFKRMGYSFDWERERFTMDEQYSDAVIESFVRLFNKGYIYRGARVINWCPRCHTAISDIEVEYEAIDGKLYYIDYPLEDGTGNIRVATTRPETMLGDTGVAVNPEDDRYLGLVGKNAILPIVGRKLPIFDDSYVDPEFGTGAVKTTPAHDPNDFEMGLRHNLDSVIVIGPDGKMTEEAGKYAGMDRYEARAKLVEELRDKGYLTRVDDYALSVATCRRCETVIEPLLSEQWFCRMKELAQPAIDVVKSGKIKFIPERYTKLYLDWMENVRDWCISRQLWWGHRIPVWRCDDCGEYIAAKSAPEVCSKCGSKNLTQDPDVLDTWFSSALWPFATLGWPKKTPDLDYFYPTNVLVTARDIIYLWVARMIFTSLEFLKEIPFHDVYIYATVQNEEGRRMSKSLGTGVDPLDLIDQYGADALRFALLQQAGEGQDMRFSGGRVEVIRNFCNKIWNASRFVLMNLDHEEEHLPPGVPVVRNEHKWVENWYLGEDPDIRLSTFELRLEDRWILSRLNRLVTTVNKGFAAYDMDDACRALYEFIWSEYCDWYLELAKPRLRDTSDERKQVQYLLWHVLETTMRLLHPVMPFITEEIWQAIPHSGDSLMIRPFPVADSVWVNETAEKQMDEMMEITRAIRNLRTELGAQPGRPVNVLVTSPSDAVRERIQAISEGVKSLARVGEITFAESLPDSEKRNYVSSHFMDFDLHVPVAGLIDVEKELSKIEQELEALGKELSRTEGKLSNEQFIARAPAEVVEKERRIQQELQEKKAKLEERLAALSSVDSR